MVRKKKAAKVPSSLSKQKPRPEAEMFSCSETEISCNGSPDNQESSFSKHEASGSSIKRKERKWDTEPEDPDALQANNEVVKKRKTRWSSDDAQLKRLGPLQLPDFQGIGETQSDFEVQELNNQLMEINKKLLELVENGNSFDPVSTKSGLSCANEIRQELINRKQQIVSKLVEKTLGLKSLPDNKPAILYKKLYIPVKQYPDYNFVGLILGPRGSTLKRMETETGAKILLRGKGSIKEDKPVVNSKIKTDPSANEDLHVRIEANNQESMDAAVEMVEKLLVPVEDNANDLKREQLFDLAVLNGKVARACTICGDIGHFTRLCPLIASHPKTGQHDDPLTGLGASAFSSITGVSVPSNVSSGRGSSAGTSNAKGLDKTNLYVGYLPDFINEVSLKQLFDPFGTIASLRVARDPATGVSKGHGFVKYCDPASAAIAIEKMHKFVIGNKTLAVRVAGPPPTTEESASPAPTYPGSPANPQSMSTPAVCPSLPQYGAYFTRTYPSVPGLSPAGLPSLLSQAAHPLASGHLPSDTGMPGPSNVSPSLGASTDYSKAKGMDDTNLYVEHLPDSVDEVRLKQLFDPFGTITGVRVARDPTTNACKGYGFVRYRDPASAALAIEKMHNFMTENKVLAVRIAGRPRNPPGSSALMASTYTGLISNAQATSQTVWPGFTPMVPGSLIPAAPALPMSLGVHHSVPGCSPSDNGVLVPSNVKPILGNSAAKGVDEANLFVGQLPEYINEVSLKQLFDTFGTVTGVKVGRDPDTGLSKGFGFVRYSDPASAAIAIEKMNRFQMGNKFLVVGIAGRPPTTPATPAPPKPTYPSSTAVPHATLTPTVSPALVQQSRYFTQANPAAFSPPISLGFHSSVPGLPLPEQPLSSVADYPTFPGWTSLTTPSQPFLDSLGTGHSRYPGFSASTAIAHPLATNPAVPGRSPFAPMQPVPSHFESSSAFVNFARHTGDASEASSMFPSAIVSSSTSSGVNFPGSLDRLPPASASLFSSQANPHTTHSSGTQGFPGDPDFFRSKLV